MAKAETMNNPVIYIFKRTYFPDGFKLNNHYFSSKEVRVIVGFLEQQGWRIVWKNHKITAIQILGK